jgi:dihydroflavonol-4-reductase
MNKEKVLVTGAGGMLGSAICRELNKQGYQVKAFCLNKEQTVTIKDIDAEFVFGTILDSTGLEEAFKDCAFVIHVAALTSVWPNRNKTVKEVNITGTKNVMEMAKKHRVKRMVHIGSASSFGKGTKQQPANESSTFEGWEYGLDYIESKLFAQTMLIEEHKRTGFPVVIINPTFMIGAFDSAPSSGKMLLSLYQNKIPGFSNGGKNFVYSADVAVAAVNALTMGRIGECYIAGNENLTYKDFFTKAAVVMEKKLKLKTLPTPLVLFAGLANSMWSRLSGKPPVISYTMARMANVHQYFSAEKAVKELKMPQTPVNYAIGQCMAWFKISGYLNEDKRLL